MTTKGFILVEGHGEVGAVHNLVTRLSAELGFYWPWANPLRWKNLHQWEAKISGGVRAGAEFIRTKPDVSALLIIRDEDDGCPAKIAPEIAAHLRTLALPFPTAFVLLRPEYEVLFLPCLGNMTSVGFPPASPGIESRESRSETSKVGCPANSRVVARTNPRSTNSR